MTAALLAAVTTLAPARGEEAPDATVKAAVEKALKRVEAGVVNYPKHRQCFSCHHQAMAVLSLTEARRRGLEIDADLLQKQIDFSLKTFRNRPAIARGQGVGGDSTGVGYMVQTLAAVERSADDTTAALIDYLLVKQRRDGTWPIAFGGDRPPTMGSLFTNSGLALFALKKYGAPKGTPGAEERQQRIDAAVARGRDWLLANDPVGTEDRVFHLRGLVWSDAEPRAVDRAREALRKEQRTDGSWAQLPGMSGDAYATATALVALRHAGLDVKNEAYQKGVQYLLGAQREDGAWLVPTRSRPLQVYFDNGDVGGKSQFISFQATNWAVIALLETLPPVGPGRAAAP
jgi:N-acyl-D-amino-acid deacylase